MNAGFDPSAVAGIVTDGQFRAQPSHADVSRFQQLVDSQPLSPHTDFYVDGPSAATTPAPEINAAAASFRALNAEMREALHPKPMPLPDSAPIELHVMNLANVQMQHHSATHTQFMIAVKVVEHSLRSVQTLYKLQG